MNTLLKKPRAKRKSIQVLRLVRMGQTPTNANTHKKNKNKNKVDHPGEGGPQEPRSTAHKGGTPTQTTTTTSQP